MRQAYIVSYDICDPKRLVQVYRLLRGWGDALQKSVFRCDLNPRERVELQAALEPIIDHRVDQVMFVDFGPVAGRAEEAICTLGRAYVEPERSAIIV